MIICYGIPRKLTKQFLNFFSFFFWPCCMACWILVPQSGIEPGALAVKEWNSPYFLKKIQISKHSLPSEIPLHFPSQGQPLSPGSCGFFQRRARLSRRWTDVSLKRETDGLRLHRVRSSLRSLKSTLELHLLYTWLHLLD